MLIFRDTANGIECRLDDGLGPEDMLVGTIKRIAGRMCFEPPQHGHVPYIFPEELLDIAIKANEIDQQGGVLA